MFFKGKKEKIPLVRERVEYIKDLCQGKKVFHLGCTSFPYTEELIKTDAHLHLQLVEIAGELYGMDFDQEGIDILKDKGVKNLYRGDLEKLEELELEEKFDVIIAGEMIEHLNNPGLFLNGIKKFMKPETQLVITTINAYSGLRFAVYFLLGKGGVNEPVHPDHVAYYSYKTLNLLLERHELDVRKFLFYDLGSEHRNQGHWYFDLINDISVKFTPQFADGLIAVCGLRKNS